MVCGGGGGGGAREDLPLPQMPINLFKIFINIYSIYGYLKK